MSDRIPGIMKPEHLNIEATGLIIFWQPRRLSLTGRPVTPMMIPVSPPGPLIGTGSRLPPVAVGIMQLVSVALTQVMLFQ